MRLPFAVLLGSATLTVAAPGRVVAQDTVRFTPTVGHPTFAVREPVLRIKPNTVLISNTMFGPYYTEEGGAFPGEVGPFYIEGATTSDMVAVQIIKVTPNHDLAAARVSAGFGGLSTDSRLRLLNAPIESRRYVWRLDKQNMTGTTTLPDSRMRTITIDLKPMLGRVAVAPRGQEAFGGLWPGDFGGNMDAPEVREGTTVYLPVFHEGAYLIDAFRLAHVELIEWMVEDYGFSKTDAYALVGQLGESTVANIVDPAYTVVAKFPKKYLPPR